MPYPGWEGNASAECVDLAEVGRTYTCTHVAMALPSQMASPVLHLAWQGSALQSRRMKILPITLLLSFPGRSLPASSLVLLQ